MPQIEFPLGQPPSLHPLRRDLLPPCSRASQVLRSCQTSRVRSSSAHPFGLRLGGRRLDQRFGKRGISRFPNMTLPCVLGLSDHGEPSRASRLTACSVWPSASPGWRQHSQDGLFEIPYPARRFPCQRFGLALRFHRMTRGRDGSLLLSRRGLPPLNAMPVSTGAPGLTPWLLSLPRPRRSLTASLAFSIPAATALPDCRLISRRGAGESRLTAASNSHCRPTLLLNESRLFRPPRLPPAGNH